MLAAIDLRASTAEPPLLEIRLADTTVAIVRRRQVRNCLLKRHKGVEEGARKYAQ